MTELRENFLMNNQPFYAENRYASDAAAQQAVAEAELADYRRKFGVRPGEVEAERALQERIRRSQLVIPLEDREFPVYR